MPMQDAPHCPDAKLSGAAGDDSQDLESGEPEDRTRSHNRPFLILLFAAILVCIASVAKSEDVFMHHPIPTQAVIQAGGSVMLHSPRVQSASHQGATESRSKSPAYAELVAELSNFDADAEPDGLRVALALRDKNHQLSTKRATAKFELCPMFATAGGYALVETEELERWTRDVKFGADGVARFTLPIQQRLRPLFGTHSLGSHSPVALNKQPLHRSHLNGSRDSAGARWKSTLGPKSSILLRDALSTPPIGRLGVRVSVPTEGVFSAEAFVLLP